MTFFKVNCSRYGGYLDDCVSYVLVRVFASVSVVVSSCISIDVSVGVSASSMMGIAALNEFPNDGFIPSSVMEDGTSSMIIGFTTLPDHKCKLLQGRGGME